MRSRDNQRSRVYAWEHAVEDLMPETAGQAVPFGTIEECAAYAAPVWRKERGRLGLAKQVGPRIERPSWGQRRALAHRDHRITLPRWARTRWTILHELAHRLTPADEAHGPRFVGVLMGLAARWLGCDTARMMALADEMGVRYYVRSIGVVPTYTPVHHVERVALTQGPMTAMDLACHLSLAEGVPITQRQVRGAALALIKAGRARWLRKKLVMLPGAGSQAGTAQDQP